MKKRYPSILMTPPVSYTHIHGNPEQLMNLRNSIETICRCIRFILKGNVSVISSDPPCKDGNARFTLKSFVRSNIK